jgi:hypothetical protein
VAAVSAAVAEPAAAGSATASPSSEHAILEARLAEQVATARDALAQASELGGVKGDPLAKVLEVISLSLGALHALHVTHARHYGDVVEELEQRGAELADRVRQPLDPDALRRLEKSAASGAARQAASLARSFALRTTLVAALVLGSSVAAGIGGGYWWGARDARAAVNETEHGLAEAFRAGPQDAATWLALMRINDIRAAVQACEHDNLWTDKAGRRACALHVWLDPPPPSVPQH